MENNLERAKELFFQSLEYQFRGDLNNVAKRLCKAAELNKAKYFLRINGDSPLINYKIIDRAIQIFKKKEVKIMI